MKICCFLREGFMFSGIVETTGFITTIEQQAEVWRLTIEAPAILDDVKLGDSIAINGVCLTVIDFTEQHFVVEVVPETQRCTNFHLLKVGSLINLERAMKAEQRIGGHYVQGHVDAVAKILSVITEGDAWLVTFSLPEKLQAYLVPKGFISIDGMSLTVINVNQDSFTVTLIPHTQQVTIAKNYQQGSLVNLEVDMLGKYVVKFMEAQYAE